MLGRVRAFARVRVAIFRDKLDEEPLSALRPGGGVSHASWLDTLARGFHPHDLGVGRQPDPVQGDAGIARAVRQYDSDVEHR